MVLYLLLYINQVTVETIHLYWYTSMEEEIVWDEEQVLILSVNYSQRNTICPDQK